MTWLADDLIITVRRRCRIPDGGAVMTDAELLACADERTLSRFVPFLRSLGEEYGIATTDYALAADVTSYRIPARAAGTALRDAVLLNADGIGVSLPRISLEDRDAYGGGASAWWRAGAAICLERSEVVIRPSPIAAGSTLRLRYLFRPSRLVLSTQVAAVQTINLVTAGVIKRVTFTVAGTDPADGSIVDWVQASPGFDVLTVEDEINDLGGGIWELTRGVVQSSLSSGGVVGDYVCPAALAAGTTPVVQLPEVLHSALATAVQIDVYHAMREHAVRVATEAALERELAEARKTLTPRVSGEAERVVNRNSFLRRGGHAGWR